MPRQELRTRRYARLEQRAALWRDGMIGSALDSPVALLLFALVYALVFFCVMSACLNRMFPARRHAEDVLPLITLSGGG